MIFDWNNEVQAVICWRRFWQNIGKGRFAHLADFARSMKNISEDLAPYMKVYAMKWEFRISHVIQWCAVFEKTNDQIQNCSKGY